MELDEGKSSCATNWALNPSNDGFKSLRLLILQTVMHAEAICNVLSGIQPSLQGSSLEAGRQSIESQQGLYRRSTTTSVSPSIFAYSASDGSTMITRVLLIFG